MNELIVRNDNALVLDADVAARLAKYEEAIKSIKKTYDDLKDAILKEMEDKGIIKVDSEFCSITYIAPTDREKFDSKAFKEAYRDIYDEYVTMVPVKSSIRVKVK